MHKIKTLGALVAGALLCALAPNAGAEPARPEQAAAVQLRIVDYNIQHGYRNGENWEDPDAKPDITRTANAIKALKPDIVTMQEVNQNNRHGDYVDQPAELAKQLNLKYYYYGDNRPDSKEKTGNLVLSRFPILNKGNTILPHDTGKPRGMVYAKLDVHGKQVRLFNTHLAHDSASWRGKQVTAALHKIGSLAGPTLLTGDMNAKPSHPEIKKITGYGFTDTWAKVSTGKGYTHPADTPNKRIDYVFASKAFSAVRGSVTNTKASDHRPVVIDVTLS